MLALLTLPLRPRFIVPAAYLAKGAKLKLRHIDALFGKSSLLSKTCFTIEMGLCFRLLIPPEYHIFSKMFVNGLVTVSSTLTHKV